jgi:hypothetical protein
METKTDTAIGVNQEWMEAIVEKIETNHQKIGAIQEKMDVAIKSGQEEVKAVVSAGQEKMKTAINSI